MRRSLAHLPSFHGVVGGPERSDYLTVSTLSVYLLLRYLLLRLLCACVPLYYLLVYHPSLVTPALQSTVPLNSTVYSSASVQVWCSGSARTGG